MPLASSYFTESAKKGFMSCILPDSNIFHTCKTFCALAGFPGTVMSEEYVALYGYDNVSAAAVEVPESVCVLYPASRIIIGNCSNNLPIGLLYGKVIVWLKIIMIFFIIRELYKFNSIVLSIF